MAGRQYANSGKRTTKTRHAGGVGVLLRRSCIILRWIAGSLDRWIAAWL
jgi:hypothetical protein